MRVLEIGCGLHYTVADHGKFRSTLNFLDYDLVVWNLHNLRDEYHTSGNFHIDDQGRTVISSSASKRVIEELDRRRAEITEMMDLGRSIVLWTCHPQDTKIIVHAGSSYQVVDLLDRLHVPVKTRAMTGENMEFRGGEPFVDFWIKNRQHLYYRGEVVATEGKPLFFVKGTNRVVGTYLNVGRGNFLVLPSFAATGRLSRTEFAGAEEAYVLSLIRLIEDLKKMGAEPELPSWSKDYLLPGEGTHLRDLRQLEDKLEEVRMSIERQTDLLAEMEKYKLLFSGSGNPLERQVKHVFEELGFTVGESQQNRDDILLAYGNRVAVAEVKGVSKSAAEKHATQLEKWVSEYHLAHGLHPKGFLVINAYSGTPLEDRSEDAFPHQMLAYSESRGHCLITGQQLLCLYLDCKEDHDKKAEMPDRLFATEGWFSEYRDWSAFLTKQD